jgi:hypothetical protein
MNSLAYFRAMKAATLHELKQEMMQLPTRQLTELCLRLGRFKKENKELLTYLIFEADDERAFISNAKAYMDADFEAIPKDNNLYLIKKSLRKILRMVTKYVRFAGSKIVETELLLYYCTLIRQSGIAIHQSTALTNLYEAQIKKVKKILPALHEDLQYDYGQLLEELSMPDLS